MLLGRIYTIPLNSDTDGVGQYELGITVLEEMFRAAADKTSLVKTTIAQHLAACVEDTQVPANCWRVALDPRVASACNLPHELNFGE